MIIYLLVAMVVGSVASFFIGGIALALIFLIIWIDKSIILIKNYFLTIATIFLGNKLKDLLSPPKIFSILKSTDFNTASNSF